MAYKARDGSVLDANWWVKRRAETQRFMAKPMMRAT